MDITLGEYYMKINTTRQDWKKIMSYLAVYIAAITIGVVLLLPKYWYIWIIVVAFGMILLVRWHSKAAVYRCTNCGNEFQVSIVTDFLSPQGVGKDYTGKPYGWKYLKCPACEKRMKAVIVKMK
jgi:DNA-directed RNA polymerase subunit RPC12/RpoP